MKKIVKSCLLIILVLVGLIVAGVAILAAKDLCPPEGPWPAPPWCDGSEELFYIDPQDIPIDVGSPLSFTVQVPENTPPHTTVYLRVYTESGNIVQNGKMEQIGEREWMYDNISLYGLLKANGTLKYRYNRNDFGYSGAEEFTPDSPDFYRTISVNDDLDVQDTIEKWRWMPGPDYQAPDVVANLIDFEPRVNGQDSCVAVWHVLWMNQAILQSSW